MLPAEAHFARTRLPTIVVTFEGQRKRTGTTIVGFGLEVIATGEIDRVPDTAVGLAVIPEIILDQI